MLSSKLCGFLEPRPLETHCYYAEDGSRYMIGFTRPLPRVIQVTDRLLLRWDPKAPTLCELGYEEYDRDLCTRSSYWARRPWLWLLRAAVGARNACWRLLGATHGRLWHTLIHRDGCEFRWRDVRPGSGALETSRADAANWRMEADRLLDEAAKMKSGYEKGLCDGWDAHQQALEDLLDRGAENDG